MENFKWFTVDQAITQLQELSAAGFGGAPILKLNGECGSKDGLQHSEGFALCVPSGSRRYPHVEVE